MTLPSRKTRARRSVRRLDQISRWLIKAGVRDAELRARVAVDLSDALDAADHIRFHLSALVRTDPTTKVGSDRAMTHTTAISVWAFSELRYHVLRLQRSWDSKIEPAVAKLPRKRPAA